MKNFLSLFFWGRKPDDELANRAARLLGVDPNAPKRPGQKVPQELVARMHQFSILTGHNTCIGYEIDDYRKSWKEFYDTFDYNLERLTDLVKAHGNSPYQCKKLPEVNRG